VRIFVGIAVDAHVQREVERAGDALRRRIGARLGANWVAPENLHFTVRFVGHVPEGRAPAVIEALAASLDTPAFEVRLSAYGRFPAHGAPRVIWIGLTRGLPQLAALHEEFNGRLAPLGYPPEDRPFNVHLTVARIKHAPAGSGRFTDEALATCDFEPLVQRVDRVTIFESHLSPQGPRYAVLRELSLQTPT
jgi:2'-5' RNA ligase